MGLDVYSFTILGVRVRYEDFFVETGTQVSCVRCLHVAKNGEKFCPNDGQKLSTIAIEQPTPGFAKFATAKGMNAKDAFGAIYNPYKQAFGIYNVSSIRGSESERYNELAVGMVLGKTDSNRGGSTAPVAITLEQANEIAEEIADYITSLGIHTDNEPEIFTSVYLSY